MKFFFRCIPLLCASIFSEAFQTRPKHNAGARKLRLSSDSYSELEAKEMEDLILSISLEESDDSRRNRLHSVFTDALARPNGGPDRFSSLFNATLIAVGDKVRNLAMQNMQNASKDEKAAKERQVWALVDMMVQSKTIVKKSKDSEDRFE